ncbi:MAG TPA: PEP-CTERM sorting domain-containing protein [Phycisphaerae bacterium]|nr:PEP-CTERM sorting domain-containing protein [Phycisphaerae bacterium]
MRLLVAVLAALCVPVAASADVAWDNPGGNAENFDWAGGHNSDTNLFGSPSWYGGDNLYFLSSDFAPYANGTPVTDSATDTMDVDLTAVGGKKFASIAVFEYGDYNIVGGAGNTVSADLGMTGTAAGHPMSPFLGSFSFGAAGDSAGTVPWNDDAALSMEFAVPDVTTLHLSVTNTLVAISDGAGGTASIQGNFVLLGIAVTVIPEPASMSLLALGGLAVLRRRRR